MAASIEEIREVLEIFLDSELQDLRLEIGDVRLSVSKNGAGLAAQPFERRPAAPAAAAVADGAAAASPAPLDEPASVPADWVAVTAPSVGVFYRRPAPDQPPFVEEGGEVAENDPIGLIEVMKMFTAVTAPCRGRIARIELADAAGVEYGQTLMYIEPA